MRVGSLFSGIGGIDLGLERAGMDIVFQVEKDKRAARVLYERFPNNTLLLDDVCDVRANDVPRIDLLCGGFPCQDISVAGARAGLDGDRSGLWHEFRRLADELAARWVLIENVPGLFSSADGEDLAVILGGLTGHRPRVPEDGWRNSGVCVGPKRWAVWRVLDSQHFGVPQRRRRVFIVAGPPDRPAPEILLEPESVRGDSPAVGEAREDAPAHPQSGVTSTLGAGGGRARQRSPARARDRPRQRRTRARDLALADLGPWRSPDRV